MEEIEDAFVIERDSGEPDSQGQIHSEAAVRELPSDLIEQIHTLLKAIRKISPSAIPDKAMRDEITLLAVHRALELRLAQYPTTQVYDFDLLSANKVSGRQKKAMIVRWGEKVLLQEAIDFAQEKLLKAQSKAGQESEPHAKRQRTR